VVEVATLGLVVELVASGRVVVVVGSVGTVVSGDAVVDVVAAAVTGVNRVELVVGADGSITAISPCIPRLPCTRQ
jgi:hypothetical protein